jgi:2-hydroxychromene-2-carboxylate isomerase
MEFWFSIGSTYTYLSVMRLERVERESGIAFSWQPFNVREIMREMGNNPFANKPPKLAYMWRDVERRAKRYGIPFAGPAPYPLHDLPRVNRVAVLAFARGWGKPFVQAAYRGWFLERRDVSLDEPLSAVLSGLGRDPASLLAEADAPPAHAALAAQTQAARELGVFGAPTFVSGRELFWGDDRLEDAIAWERGA